MGWSLTKYGRYHKCPAAYDYKYNQKLEEPKSRAAQRGTDIHAQIEGYLKTGEWTSNISKFAKEKAEEARRDNYQAEVKVALDENWVVVAWDDPKAWVRGVIDAIKVLPDEIHMAEWKSGKVWDDHPLQRNLYLIFGLSMFDIPAARITTIYTDLEYGVEDKLARSELDSSRAAWNERVAPMFRDTFFSPRPGQHCSYCPFSTRKGGPCPY